MASEVLGENNTSSTEAIAAMLTRRWSGVWKGQGQVWKQNGDVAIQYKETLIIKIVRKSSTFVVLNWQQDTQHAETGTPLHTEIGFVRIETEDTIQRYVVTAGFTHPFPAGILNEMSRGTFIGDRLELLSKDFQRASPDQKKARSYVREYEVTGPNTLSYTHHLNEKLHLKCDLKREE
jgi:THAP4-like, heme-binding beta-barrel domain